MLRKLYLKPRYARLFSQTWEWIICPFHILFQEDEPISLNKKSSFGKKKKNEKLWKDHLNHLHYFMSFNSMFIMTLPTTPKNVSLYHFLYLATSTLPLFAQISITIPTENHPLQMFCSLTAIHLNWNQTDNPQLLHICFSCDRPPKKELCQKISFDLLTKIFFFFFWHLSILSQLSHWIHNPQLFHLQTMES